MPPAETLTITLPPDMLRALRESVEAGAHATIDDALGAAVRAWQRQRREDAEHLETIRARIRRSLDDPRPSLSLEEVEAHMEALFAETRRDRRRA
ncbi:type II toxin-antitoxin system ParD family antitoxin [Methylobacterium sp. NEAU 140]|uniref:ribbon-helix-helix domain-containing protein n=1 Tax=Methylobacterium sp. NEAU 140 TaxID=3064945 RepID=UPI002735141E|nr:type II toxin-antitoxin system ParD family antitoxin [Methylobacterium sp. NEAU 140]MDP4024216.1 type II toxin-antitoxin system ParD family antitoxin [Methylobacterium sp. NEAU 140]